jgi:RHS repeat-associated protein
MQVATTSDFSSTIWSTDSSGSPIANLGNNTRSPDIAYLGLPLDFATTTYYWRVKFGNGPYGGSWSDTNVFTTVNANVLQNLYYTYDAVGNITKIIDHSDTNAAKTMEYSYDDLNRLLTASSTNAANIQDYYQAYSYDAIGNITNKSDIGSYTYSSTGYTNPHAVTTIGSTNYSYDNNGNLTSSTGGFTNTWNYKNQLTESGNYSATSTYAYDHAGNRVRRTDINPTTVTTYYPSEYYNFQNATTTKHIYAGNQLIASVQSCVWPGDANRNGTTDFTDMAAMSQHYNGPGNYSQGDFNNDGFVDFSDQVILSQNYNTSCPTSIASTTVNFVHTDHLSGSNIVSNEVGEIIENMDYYPFGEIRIDDKITSFNEQNKFTGHDYDALNGYSYMKARYQDGKTGKFINQDPMFLNIGSLNEKAQKGLLTDPQQLNSYAYARNNPLVYTDPTGQCVDGVSTLACIAAWTFLSSIATGHVLLLYGAITGDTNTIETGFALNDVGTMGGSGLGQSRGMTNPVTGQKGVDLNQTTNSRVSDPAKSSVVVPIIQNVTVKNFNKVIYKGNINLTETMTAIENGTLLPRLDNTGNPKLFKNRENLPGLDYSNGNQYYEYNVIKSGAPANTAERMLKGTIKNDVHYSSDHYTKSIYKIK